MKPQKNFLKVKFLMSFSAGLLVFVFAVNAGTITIPSNISNALQVIQRLFITADGTQDGTPIMDINTGGSIVVYGPLLDGGGSPYRTGDAIESDPVWMDASGNYYTKDQIDNGGFITSESDPLFMASAATGVTSTKISHWNTAYGRGDHAAQGYLKTESDAVFIASPAYTITSQLMADWSQAHARGDRSNQGFLTEESDPMWSGEKHNYYTKAEVDILHSAIAGGLKYKGGRDYSTGQLPSNITLGDFYVLTNPTSPEGYDFHMESPDQIVANKTQAGPSASGDRDVIENDSPEVDPLFVGSPAYEISATNISHWSAAYSRVNTYGRTDYLTEESDPLFMTHSGDYYTKYRIDHNVVGTTGATGPQGEVGPQGPAGARGATGTNGSNGAKGETGATGPQGEVGPQGPAGATGATGETGAAGSQGIRGATGADGTNGIDGVDGIDGINGATGATGPQGVTGARGATGAQGERGLEGLSGAVAELSNTFIPYRNGSQFINSNFIHSSFGGTVSGDLFVTNHFNIGSRDNALYPFYAWTENIGDDRSNYITVDGPASQEKGFQIGAGPTSADYQRARYTDANEGGDKMYFVNGESNRDVLTLAGGGRVGINVPTLLGTKTPPDLFSIFPQYFDGVLVYNGSGDYTDRTSDAYGSAGDSFVVAGGSHYLLLGKMNRRRAMYVNIDTAAGNSSSMSVEYSTLDGDGWASVVSGSDTTNRLKVDGSITRDMSAFQSSWQKKSINGGSGLYWIKVSLNGLVGNNPTVKLITNNGVNRFAIYAGAGDKSPVFTVDANGRVGIAPAELNGKYEMGRLPGIPLSKMEIVANDGNDHDIVYYLADDDSGNDMAIDLVKSRGTVESPEAVIGADVLGGFHAMGYDSYKFSDAANIIFSVDGTPGSMDMPGKISFSTTPDGDEIPVERMTIKNNGYVGIGTTGPTQELTVNGNINVTNGHTIYNGAGNPYLTTASLNGYLTGFEELDPIWSAQKSNYYDKTGVDTLIENVRAGMVYQGLRDYSAGVLPADVHKGDLYEIGTGSTGHNGLDLYIRDIIIANKDVVGATVGIDWTVIIMDANPNIDPIFTNSAAYSITNTKISNWNTAYSWGDRRSRGFITGYTETDPIWLADKSDYYTSVQVDNKHYLTGETDPIFAAHSGDYYPIGNPNNYISAASVPWTIGADITNTNTGEVHINTNLFTSGHINIGANTNTIYPFYVWANTANAQDPYSNYVVIDGPDTAEKGFQIGAGETSEDYKRAWYTNSGEDGDQTYFANGNSKRDILTMSAAGRVGINVPTDLESQSNTPRDAFSLYPQYFDAVMRYNGTDTYYDNTESAYNSMMEAFVIVNDANDTLLVGKEYPRRSIYINIDTPASNPGELQAKYSTAGGRGGVVGLTDTTDALKQDGSVGWTLTAFKSSWAKKTISGHTLYWIQLSLPDMTGTPPKAMLITNLGVNRFSLFAGAADINPFFTIDANGRVGLLPPELTGRYEMGKLPGIPQTKMEIVSNDNDQYTTVHYLADNESDENMNIIFAKSKGTVDQKVAVQSDDMLGGVLGYGYDGINFSQAAGIAFSIDGTPSVGDMPGKISFSTAPDGTKIPVERMTIKNNGHVGIGTTGPTQTLTVNGNINVTSGHGVYDGAGNAYVTLADLSGRLVDENDPIWTLDKPNYATKTELNNAIAGAVGALTYKGGRDYSTGILPSNITKGDLYVITNITGSEVYDFHIEAPDQIIANKTQSGATTSGDWDVIENDWNETDPIFLASTAYTITSQMIVDWNQAHGRGDRHDAGFITGYTETDPTFVASDVFHVTSSDIADRNSAFIRGNHANAGYLKSFTELDPVRNAAKTDYYTITQINAKGYLTGGSLAGYLTASDLTPYVLKSQTGNWNTAYSRGDHAAQGYLKSSDLVGYLTASALTPYVLKSQTGNWNTAFGRGNHADAGYLTAEVDSVFINSDAYSVTNSLMADWSQAHGRGDHAAQGYLKSSDLVGYLTASALTPYVLKSQTGNWNTAFGRGNHADAGYLTAETDPDFTSSVAHGITSGNISNRTTAYSRGDHASAGYIKSYTETDPTFTASAAHGIAALDITHRNTDYTWFMTNSGNALSFINNSGNYYTKTEINNKGYLTGGIGFYVPMSATGDWNAAYSRGDHASAGYLTGGSLAGYVTASALNSYVGLSLTGTWNTSYTWMQNNSGKALYFRNNSGDYYTKTEIDNKGYLTGGSIAGFGFTLDIQALTSNPSDGQTIYFGQIPSAATTTAGNRKIYIRKAGAIKLVNVYAYSSTAGSNEARTGYIRLNNATDYLIQRVSLSTSERVRSNSSLDIPVVAGDYVEIKMTNPSWGTNPNGTVFGGYVYIE